MSEDFAGIMLIAIGAILWGMLILAVTWIF